MPGSTVEMSSWNDNPEKYPTPDEVVRGVRKNLDPILQLIRIELGDVWLQYIEYLEAIIQGYNQGEDTSAWTIQLEQLVNSREDITQDHSGVIFIYQSIGIRICPPSHEPRANAKQVGDEGLTGRSTNSARDQKNKLGGHDAVESLLQLLGPF